MDTTERPSKDLTILFFYRKPGTYALNALAGALASDPATEGVELCFPGTMDELAKGIETASSGSRKVLVGWSFYSPQFLAVSGELSELKSGGRAANVVHIAGGVHATAEPAQTLSAGFDLVACGEGEGIIVELAKRLASDQSVDDIPGLAFCRDGGTVRNGRGALISLDDYPPFPSTGKMGPIEITRGCIYSCKFCQTPFVSKARFRHRSVGNICEHARTLKRVGSRYYRFITPTSLSYGTDDEHPNLDAIEELLAALRRTIGGEGRLFYGTFPSEVRPEHVTPEALRLLKRYVDNDNLIIGGQSGSQRVLDRAGRGHSVEAVERAVRICLEEGFEPNVDFLFGMPGEEREDARASVTLARRLADLGARVHTHAFMPLPGTPFMNQGAAVIDEGVRRELESLSSEGKAYGQWKRQIKVADELAARRAGRF
jgi:B12-binding domain/radical SAM domain protein